MQQEYVRLLNKFYSRMVEGSRQAQLLTHSLQRFLSYEVKEEEKLQRQREKEGSLRSGSSNASLSGFEKVKRLFYSNHLETALLFYYALAHIQSKETPALLRILAQAHDRLKGIKNGPSTEDRRRFASKLAKFSQAIEYLQGRVTQGRTVDWLFFEAFKEFQSEAVLTMQLLGSTGDGLESLQNMQTKKYAEVLKTMKAECCLFDYSTREGQVFGGGFGEKLFIGRRSDTYFVLTEKEYERAFTTGLGGSRKQESSKEDPRGPSAKFKEEFLAEMVRLRQGYEANTATIATLFHFKDAGEGRTSDEINQA